jgi:G8 domain
VALVALLLLASTESEAHIVAELAPDAQATHKAVTSGNWSNPATWGGGVPGSNGQVMIPSGIVVTVDQQIGATLFWIRVDGTLRFAPNASTSLTAESVFVNHGGRLEIGTQQSPIQADKTATLIIKALNHEPINHSWDPLEFSRGVVAESRIEIHGASKTSWTYITDTPAQGATKLTLDEAPSG